MSTQRETHSFKYSFLYFKLIFNGKIIALQYCVGFCHTATWISHRYTYVPSLLNLPPTSHPSRLLQRCYRAPVRVPLAIQLIPIGYVERWYWWTYLQGSNGDIDIEDRLTDPSWGAGGEEKQRVGWTERVAWKHTLPYVKLIA